MSYLAASKRTTRAKIACSVCNARRVRCNAVVKQPCDNCESRGLSCTLVESRRGKRPTKGNEGRPDHQTHSRSATSHSAHSSPVNREVRTSQRLPSLSCASDTYGDGAHLSSSGQHTASDSIRDETSPEAARTDLTNGSRSVPDAQNTIFLGEASSVAWTKKVTDQAGIDQNPREESIRLTFPAPPDHTEKSSTLSLAQSARKAQRLGYLHVIGALNFPDNDVCEEMLTAYFKWFHPCFPILDRPSFCHDYASKTVSPLLLQAVLFIAATYCEPSLLQKAGFIDVQDARVSFYNNAQDIYDADYEKNKVTVVQALFLMSYWRDGPQSEKNTRRWLAAAVSLAQELGMHRARASAAEQVEQSLRKRIWWTLYVRDRQSSVAVGMPWFIHDGDYDVEELTVNDFHEDLQTDLPKFIDQQTNEHIQYPIEMVKLVRIMGDIVKTEFRLFDTHTKASELAELKRRLCSWEGQLPQEIKSQPDIGCDSKIFASMLDAYHYNVYILLHRSAYVGSKQNEEKGEGQVALQAACKITGMAEDLLAQNVIHCVNSHMITCFFNSLCIHTISLRRFNEIGRQVAEKRAQICLLALQELRKTWDVNNWILKLYFEHIGNPIKKGLQTDDVANPTSQQNQDSRNISGASSGSTQAASALPYNLPNDIQHAYADSAWSSAFFNSKEAENISLYQLEPSLFGDASLDFTFDPSNNFPLNDLNGFYLNAL